MTTEHAAHMKGSPFADEEDIFEAPAGTDDETPVVVVVGDEAADGDAPDPNNADDVRNYSEAVQKRISKLRFDFHEAERKATAEGDRASEAIRFAQGAAAENQRLRDVVNRSSASLIETMKGANTAEMVAARAAYKDAHESGDSALLLDAQEKLARVAAEGVQLEAHTPTAPPAGEAPAPAAGAAPAAQQQHVQPNGQQPQPVDPKFTAWLGDNASWFQKKGNEEMTQFAIGVHHSLVAQNIHPQSDEYYEKIDARLRVVYPDSFSKEEGAGDEEIVTEIIPNGGQGRQGKAPAPTRTGGNVVAAATRTGGPTRRTVELTASQVALARRIGVTPEEYAAQVAKES